MKIIAVLVLPLLLTAPVLADDWPRFLGPTGNNVSKETGLLDTFPKSGPREVFAKRIGTGYSPVSVRDGRVVVFHRVSKLIKIAQADSLAGILAYINGELVALGAKERITKESLSKAQAKNQIRGYLLMPPEVAKHFDQEVVDCLDAKTGKLIWRHAYPTTYEDPYGYNNGPRCVPLLTANRCYTFGAQGVLSCLDFKTGKTIWRRNVIKDWKAPENFFGVGSAPLLEGNMLITMVGGQPNSGIAAIDAKTGKTIWESVGKDTWHKTPKLGWPGEPLMDWLGVEKQASYSSPVVATVHGRRVAFCLMRQGLVALDVKTGKVLFKRWFRASNPESVNASNPVVIGNHVFCSTCYYGIGSFVLKIKKDLSGYDVVWSTIQLREANRRHDEVLGLHWMTPIYHEGNLYASSGRNEPDASFRCVEYKTGKLLWEVDEGWQKFGRPTDKYGRSSLVMADGKLIVLGETGKLGLYKVDARKPIELANYKSSKLNYPCWGGPALANKKLYIRSEDHLVCLDLAKTGK